MCKRKRTLSLGKIVKVIEGTGKVRPPIYCLKTFNFGRDSKYYPGQKNHYSREIHEVDRQFDHVISYDIKLRFDIHATRSICAS